MICFTLFLLTKPNDSPPDDNKPKSSEIPSPPQIINKLPHMRDYLKKNQELLTKISKKKEEDELKLKKL